ncbi:dolichyl-P-Man:Man(5)GlcNAc(2)-PP-dolichol alpha-1,3-mannosyltransferase, partial [Cladochytrium tenue]
YPAGFLYAFAGLQALTDGGRDIRTAQWIFAALEVVTVAVIVAVYRKSAKVPWYVMPLLLLSKRIHSIFVLRLFNDPVAMLPMYLCVLALSRGRAFLAATLFSLALSVKMNVLLFAPGFAVAVLAVCTYPAPGTTATTTNSRRRTAQVPGLARAALLAAWTLLLQVALGAPFLASHPREYLGRAFELGRAFLWEWTVNWRFAGQAAFESGAFSTALLSAHVAVLAAFAAASWAPAPARGSLLRFLRDAVSRKPPPEARLEPDCEFSDLLFVWEY